MNNWFITIHFLGAVQCVFLAAILFNKEGGSVANKMLTAVMLVFGGDLFMAVYHASGFDAEFPHLIGIDAGFAFLYGPLFYLYARTLSNREHTLRRTDAWHFLPFVLFQVILIPFYLQSGPEKLAYLYTTGASSWTVVLRVATVIKVLHAILYVAAIFHVLRTLRKNIKETHSSTERVNLLWLRNILIGIVVMVCIAVVTASIETGQNSARMLGQDPNTALDDVSLVAVSLFVYTVGYLGLRQPEIFDSRWEAYVSTREQRAGSFTEEEQETGAPEEKDELSEDKPRYSRSGMSEEAAESYKQALMHLMDEEKPYLRGDLTLLDLSESLDISPHNLTEVINTRFGKNFYEFINNYRIEEVKRRLADPEFDHLTLLAIGLDAGFNSKSSFNAVFKKQVGLTPSQFKKHLETSGTSVL